MLFENTGKQENKRGPLPNINSWLGKDIFTCTHVWIREDAVKPPLAKLFKGPHLVIDRSSKYFTLTTDQGPKKVSIDRLMSAYVLLEANYEDNEQSEEDLTTFLLKREHDDEVVETETSA